MIPYGHQSVDDDDVAAVLAVLKGDWLTQGPAVEAFEAKLQAVTGATYAVAFANGTAALHAAVAAAHLGPGDAIATSALTFNADAACARYVGATPVLIDVDPATLNLDASRIPDCDALIAVHFAGLPVDLTALPHRPRVLIEDASHAVGAVTPDGPVGGCQRSDMTTFSFHPVKTITTGEGGAVTTNDAELAGRLRRFRHHGITPHPEKGGWHYDVSELGFNYRLTDLQAALGTSQLAKLDRFVSRRNELADRYRQLLADTDVELPPNAPAGYVHAYHLFPVRVPNRDDVYRRLRDEGVGVQVHYVPVYHHSMWADLGWRVEDFPQTEAVYREILSIPMFPDLTVDEQDRVVDALLRAVAGGRD